MPNIVDFAISLSSLLSSCRCLPLLGAAWPDRVAVHSSSSSVCVCVVCVCMCVFCVIPAQVANLACSLSSFQRWTCGSGSGRVCVSFVGVGARIHNCDLQYMTGCDYV